MFRFSMKLKQIQQIQKPMQQKPKHPPNNHHLVIEQVQDTLIVKHTAGFFSCCSVKLHAIVEFANSRNSFPKHINGMDLFTMYKSPEHVNQEDITHVFFEHPSEILKPISKINYIHEHQYIPYSRLDYKNLMPIIQNFFKPSAKIIENMIHFENKYSIDAANCIAVYYRGTDKTSETKLDSFDRYYAKLNELLNSDDNANCKILLQSDSAQFFDYMKYKFRDSRHFANLVIIDEIAPTMSSTMGAHCERNGQRNHSDIKYLFAVIILISKCKHVICSSGNVSIWMMLYRGNSVNVHQNLDLAWLE
jgi:hypothetical protein